MTLALIFFLLFFTGRYARLIVNAIAFWTFAASKKCKDPVSRAKDVTVVLPTVMTSDIVPTIQSILKAGPKKLILVVAEWRKDDAVTLCKEHDFAGVEILHVPELGKRIQLVAGLEAVRTPITILADDDVQWSESMLPTLLGAFDDPNVGAAGPFQRVIRESQPSLWNILGIAYLERRNFNTYATNRIDGGISTLSGRTAAYRTHIIQSKAFYDAFLKDLFLGYLVKAGDDKFLTKWVFSRGWKINLLMSEDAILHTTLEDSPRFIDQCVRWARSHWQGNLAVALTESYWWDKHIWTCYATYLGSLMTPAVLVDGMMLYLGSRALESMDVESSRQKFLLGLLTGWILLSKQIKMLGHFRRHPEDIVWVPALWVFSYVHGLINLYALATMCHGAWGGRTMADHEKMKSKERMDSSIDGGRILIPVAREVHSLEPQEFF